MDPAASAALVAAKLALAPKIRAWASHVLDPNTSRFKEARDEMFREWVADLQVLAREQFAYLSARMDDVEARTDERVRDAESQSVLMNYARAANTEPIGERRRMLDFAAAALLDARLTVAEHSRVERIVRELDPKDVLWLSAIDRATGTYQGRKLVPAERVRFTVWSHGRADVLVAAGCIRIQHVTREGLGSVHDPDEPAGFDTAIVTREGDLVLRVLRLYVRSHPDPILSPGHERTPDDCSEEEAWGAIDTVPDLRASAIRWSAIGHVLYESPKRDFRAASPPKAKAVLRFPAVPAAEGDTVAALASPPEQSSAVPGGSAKAVHVTAQPGSDANHRVVEIQGPHDVLRWLADEVDARWT